MQKSNNTRVCELYLQYDPSNIEHAKAQLDNERLLRQQDYQGALKQFLALANKGDRTFQHNAGVLFQCIEAVRDYKMAFHWYRTSVSQNYAPAMERLGNMYEFGDGGLPVDLSAAIALYRESANQGNLHSAYNLGMILARGSSGAEKNLILAESLLLGAAEQGHALMKLNLGIVYLEELANEDLANHWFKQAYEQDAYVSLDLGDYFLGRCKGFHDTKNVALSQYWLTIAIACGHEKEVLEYFEGDRLALNAFKSQGRFH